MLKGHAPRRPQVRGGVANIGEKDYRRHGRRFGPAVDPAMVHGRQLMGLMKDERPVVDIFGSSIVHVPWWTNWVNQ